MKKLALTIAIVLGMTFAGMAQQQNGGGLFQRGYVSDEVYYGFGGNAYDRTGGTFGLGLPGAHDYDNDVDAPLGSGLAVLLGLGGAYLVAKKRKED